MPKKKLPENERRKNRAVPMSDDEWSLVEQAAKHAGKYATEYARDEVVAKAKRDIRKAERDD